MFIIEISYQSSFYNIVNVQKYKKSQCLIRLKLGGQTVAHFLLNVRGGKNQQLFAEWRQFPDQFVVLDAINGEERAPSSVGYCWRNSFSFSPL